MLNAFFLPLVIVAVLNLLLGLLVLSRNTKNSINIAFFYLVLSVAVWAVGLAGFSVSDSSSAALLWAKVYYISALAIAVSLYYFAVKFTAQHLKASYKLMRSFMVACLVYVIFLIFYPSFLTSEIVEGGSLGYEVLLDPLHYFVYSALFVVGFFQSVRLIFLSYRSSKEPVFVAQSKYLFLTVAAATSFAMFFNLILPWFENYDLIWVGPQFSIIFIAGTALGIIKYRLFNIKLVVVRSIGYLMAVGLLVFMFSALSSLISSQLTENSGGADYSVMFNAAILAVAVLAYPSLKKYFDKLTNRIFYRDAYDPQEFLDQLNKSIVSNIEIGILLRHAVSIIEQNLKSSFVQIVIPKTETTSQRIAGTKDVSYTDHELNYMRGRLVGLHRKVIVIDDLNPEEDELRKIMARHDIAVLTHLSATSFGQDQTIAFMIFGTKRSGNVYNKQDQQIINLISDSLVIAIQNALRFEEIQEFNVTLQSKVTAATNKLKRTNEKLKAMDQTKDEFISMASHQLRTPLTSVKGYLSMVLEGDAGEINPQQRKLLDQAFVSSQRMVYLIADLLNVSRLRTGKFVIDAHSANLADVAEGEVKQLKGQAESKNLTLTFDKPEGVPQLMIDETKTRQVIMNFIDNAMYYTPAGGKIDVSVTQDKNHVYFMVKDNGLGVPKDEQKHLFTKFYRAKNARGVRPDGTGLGLFMAKKVVTAQSGNILFDSTEGKGSTFGFSLPIKTLKVDSDELPHA